jgi:hypothetical protein
MAMGIVICMAIAESVHIHSVPTMSSQTACVYNMSIKRNNAEATDAPTMLSGMGFASIMVQRTIALSLSVESHCFRQGSADITSDAC